MKNVSHVDKSNAYMMNTEIIHNSVTSRITHFVSFKMLLGIVNVTFYY